jgi:hypothetical protein
MSTQTLRADVHPDLYNSDALDREGYAHMVVRNYLEALAAKDIHVVREVSREWKTGILDPFVTLLVEFEINE